MVRVSIQHSVILRWILFFLLMCWGAQLAFYGIRIQVKILGVLITLAGVLLTSLEGKLDCDFKLLDKVMIGLGIAILVFASVFTSSLLVGNSKPEPVQNVQQAAPLNNG